MAGTDFGVSNIKVAFIMTELDKMRLGESADREETKGSGWGPEYSNI